MTDFSQDPQFWGARALGALAGSAISLIYLLPKTRREAASRLVTGLACGLIFGGPTGLWLGQKLDLLDHLTGFEIMLAGATAASLSAWWGLGLLARLAARYGAKPGG
ncbi:hypothetical protein HGO38_30830 [Rhizobium sp. CG5]|uniref:DUF6107 family protein n=1 Tax=Rhizobium sp. CG5 TaxID=2726076 RepID=UPI002033D17E|nr:DUF6107 family protein [Rhizobium sp. CG5]MCM2477843.1 hypothetical protein [Rhizobium sp. CG5]